MNRRNQLLAVVLLIGFIGVGVLYFQHWVVQKPFGIVLFIGEGLTPSRIAATRVLAGGAGTPLAIDAMPHVALLVNDSNDFATPDSAAAASALATGMKVNNRKLSIDSEGRALPTIVELARRAGRATGLITNGQLSDPTAAAFYAHTSEIADREALARTLKEQARFDVVLGGGSADFVAREKGGERSDGRDLLLEMRSEGVDVIRTRAELEALPTWRRPRVFGAFAATELSFPDELEEHETQPSLADMVRRAVELLQYNRNGYLLVIDAALMRKAAEANQGERTLNETVELDRALAVAQRYVGARAMIVVCGDVALGGLTMSGSPLRHDRGIAVLGLNSGGEPWLTWASGPNGVTQYGAARLNGLPSPTASPNEEQVTAHPPQEPAAFYARTAVNAVSDTAAFGSGSGAEALHGTLHSTAVFRILRDQL